MCTVHAHTHEFVWRLLSGSITCPTVSMSDVSTQDFIQGVGPWNFPPLPPSSPPPLKLRNVIQLHNLYWSLQLLYCLRCQYKFIKPTIFLVENLLPPPPPFTHKKILYETLVLYISRPGFIPRESGPSVNAIGCFADVNACACNARPFCLVP